MAFRQAKAGKKSVLSILKQASVSCVAAVSGCPVDGLDYMFCPIKG